MTQGQSRPFGLHLQRGGDRNAGQHGSDDGAGGHLAEDIAFLKRAKVKTLSLVSMDMGDSAMVGSQSESVVTLKGKVRTLRGREMLDLKKVGSQWKITAIQWDSLPSESK